MKELCETATLFVRLSGEFRAYQRLNAQKLLTHRLSKWNRSISRIFNYFLIQTSRALALPHTV